MWCPKYMGWPNQENSTGVHTLSTRLQKNVLVLCKTQSFRFDHFNRFTVCNVFVFISRLKVPSLEIRFWKTNFHTTAIYPLTLWIAFLPEEIWFFHFFLNSITRFFYSRTMRMFRIKSNYLISSVCEISGALSTSHD